MQGNTSLCNIMLAYCSLILLLFVPWVEFRGVLTLDILAESEALSDVGVVASTT